MPNVSFAIPPIKLRLANLIFDSIRLRKLDRGSIRSILMYGLGTPYRLAFFNGPNKNIDDVLFEHIGLPHVLPLTVHLDLEPLPNTQG